MAVGLVIVSHSVMLAAGVAELAGQMAQGKVTIATAGGAEDGSLGTSMEKVLEALRQADSADGIIVLLDLGSAVMTTEMALEVFTAEQPAHRVIISPAPLVEGAVIAVVEASIGNTLDEVAAAAANAHLLPKLSDEHS